MRYPCVYLAISSSRTKNQELYEKHCLSPFKLRPFVCSMQTRYTRNLCKETNVRIEIHM